jgi:hypothetical protein
MSDDRKRESILAAGALMKRLTIDNAPDPIRSVLEHVTLTHGAEYKFSAIPNPNGEPGAETWVQMHKYDLFVIVNCGWAEVRSKAGLALEDPDEAHSQSQHFFRKNYTSDASYAAAIIQAVDDAAITAGKN